MRMFSVHPVRADPVKPAGSAWTRPQTRPLQREPGEVTGLLKPLLGGGGGREGEATPPQI